MSLKSVAAALRWRVQPARFDVVGLDVVPLADIASAVPDLAALLGTTREFAFVQMTAPERIHFDPDFVLGSGELVPVPAEATAPGGRIYRLNTPMRIFGKGLFVRGNDLLKLPEFEFCELGRFDYPAHKILMQVEADRATAHMPSRVHVIEEPCLYLAQGGETIWGHWLVDLLPRLVTALCLPESFRIVIDADAPAFAVDLLAMVGVKRSRIIRHDKFRYTLHTKDVYVPSFLRYGNALSSSSNRAWTSLTAPGCGDGERIYISRSRGADGSTVVNSAEVEQVVRRFGYRVLHPETLSLPERIELFSRASHIVGEFGSGMHNSVFAPAGTRVGVLQSTRSDSYVQLGIGAIRQQPTSIAFGPAEQSGRTFLMPLDTIRAMMERLAEPTAA